MRKFTIVAAAMVLSGCVGGHLVGVKGSPRHICYEAGHQPGTAAFNDCWQAGSQQAQRDLINALAVGTAVVGAQQGGTGSALVKEIPATKTSTRQVCRADPLRTDVVGNPLYICDSVD